jgi:hypothetical protein
MSSTVTIQTVANLARIHVELAPVVDVGGFTGEPTLSLANSVLQEVLSPTMEVEGGASVALDWKWNRAEMPMFPTAPNKQDYQIAGASAFSLGSTQQGWSVDLTTNNGLTQSAGVVTVKTIENHGFAIGDVVYLYNLTLANGTASAYNATLTQNGTSSTWTGGVTITGTGAKSFTFAGVTAETSGAAGITDYGWLAGGTMVGIATNSAIFPTRHLYAVRDQQPYGVSGDPVKVNVIQDLGTGIIRIRFTPVPGNTIWGVNLVYQKKAPLITSLSGFWTPIPDELGYVYRQGFLAMSYRYVNSTRADREWAKFQAAIFKAVGADDREASDRHLVPEDGFATTTNTYTWGFGL